MSATPPLSPQPLPSVRRRPTWVALTLLAAITVAWVVGLIPAGHAAASALGTVGTATPVDPDNPATTITGGASTDQWTLDLSLTSGKPTADCSADSATGQTYVYSYLVPQGTDPTTLTFPQNTPSTGLAIPIQPGGNLYEAETNAPNTGEVNPQTFGWAPKLTAAEVLPNAASSAVWEGGLACFSKTGAVTDYWNMQVTFTSSSSDPTGYTWTAMPLADPSGSSTTTSSSTTTDGSSTTSAGSSTTSAGSSTTTAGSSATTAGSSTATTGASDGSTTAGAGGSSGEATSSDPDTGSSSGSSSSGSSDGTGSLAVTGSPIRRQVDLALGAAWVGTLLVLISTAMGRRRDERRAG